jgi:hypothetical protein
MLMSPLESPAATRTARPSSKATTAPISRRTLLARTGFLLVPPEVIVSPESRLPYRVDRMLGEGGYGQAYLATRVGRARGVPTRVCIKASEHTTVGCARRTSVDFSTGTHERSAFTTLFRSCGRTAPFCTASRSNTHPTEISARSFTTRTRSGPRPPRGARSRASSRSCRSFTAARCSTAT